MTPSSSTNDSQYRFDSLISLCDKLALSSESDRPGILENLKSTLGVSSSIDENGDLVECASCSLDFDVNELGSKNLRAVDILCRGRDSEESCFALMYLMQAGADLTEQPSPSECAPLHASAFFGNHLMAATLFDLGVDPAALSNGSKQNLLGSNAIHALASGFRDSRANDYAETFGVLLGAGCDIHAKDRKKQAPMDIAMKSSGSTGVTTLVDAMLQYGVFLNTDGKTNATEVANALAKRTGDHSLLSRLSGSAFNAVLRSADALKALDSQEPVPLSSRGPGL